MTRSQLALGFVGLGLGVALSARAQEDAATIDLA